MEMAQYYHDKILTKSDTQHKLTVLKHWLDGHVFKDDFGRDYVFWLTVRPLDLNKPRNDIKAEFKTKEWHAFVVEKELQIGDRIYLCPDDQGHRRITVVAGA